MFIFCTFTFTSSAPEHISFTPFQKNNCSDGTLRNDSKHLTVWKGWKGKKRKSLV